MPRKAQGGAGLLMVAQGGSGTQVGPSELNVPRWAQRGAQACKTNAKPHRSKHRKAKPAKAGPQNAKFRLKFAFAEQLPLLICL